MTATLIRNANIYVQRGRFEEALKDIRLVFRGSSNQRVIDVKKSLETGTVVLWTPKIQRGV